ncbi:MAG TPA: hypothetical protein PKD72_09930 [Gemmatales bacterium]|nr:hypothetical protein [Gemmatales bacterium]
MREITILASSDLHGYLPALPACDLLLLGGDLCPDDTPDNQAHWLNTTFRNWLEQLPAAHIVALAGNHDFVFEHRPDLILELPWHYLQDTRVELHGLHIWGTPWQPVFFNWAFNLEELELKQKWAVIPEDTDILLLHGPPHGAWRLHWKPQPDPQNTGDTT